MNTSAVDDWFTSRKTNAMSQEVLARSTARSVPLAPSEILRYAGEVIRAEGDALARIAEQLGNTFCRAVEVVYTTRGCIIVTGMGKAGLIGQKIAATFASTGTRAHFLHPAEAIHGDLGRVHGDDVVLMLSQSGETAEVVQVLPSLALIGVPVLAVTGRPRSTVARAAAVTIDLGPLDEACSLGLAPSTSTTVMLAVGDALALVVSRMREFRAEDFARFHPGGSLGRKLSRVDDEMRSLEACRIAHEGNTVRHVIVACSKPGRRTGAIMLVDDAGRLTGMFTDSDLARLFERHSERALDGPIRNVMTSGPCTVESGTLLDEAVALMADRKISELPVVGPAGQPIGLIDVTDVVGHMDELAQPEQSNTETDIATPNVRIFDGEANAG